MVSVCLPSDALLQHLPSYLGFSYLGRGISLHGCSSKAQPLLLTLDEGYLLTAAPPDLERGIAPLGPPAPAQPLFLGHGVAPPGHRWPWMLERPLFANKAIHFIRSFILEKNHINVICVAIDILESHDLQFITEFILERTLINEMYVAVM